MPGSPIDWRSKGDLSTARTNQFLHHFYVRRGTMTSESVNKSLVPDFHARHPGGSRGPVRLSDFLNGYQRKVLDSGFRRNEREAWPRAPAWQVFIHFRVTRKLVWENLMGLSVGTDYPVGFGITAENFIDHFAEIP